MDEIGRERERTGERGEERDRDGERGGARGTLKEGDRGRETFGSGGVGGSVRGAQVWPLPPCPGPHVQAPTSRPPRPGPHVRAPTSRPPRPGPHVRSNIRSLISTYNITWAASVCQCLCVCGARLVRPPRTLYLDGRRGGVRPTPGTTHNVRSTKRLII